jgi:hypothetical protein
MNSFITLITKNNIIYFGACTNHTKSNVHFYDLARIFKGIISFKEQCMFV